MNIAVFGGAFDPPHVGHLTIARQLLQQQLAQEIWFLPVKYHPFSKQMTEEHHRLAMLQLILESHMDINTFELSQHETNYTYKTLHSLSDQYPEHKFSFVIGSDNLKNFDQWDNFKKLVAEFTFFVYPRAGYPMQPLQKNMSVLANVTEVNVSSTQVRQAVKVGQPISDLVPPSIERYIHQHNLYKE